MSSPRRLLNEEEENNGSHDENVDGSDSSRKGRFFPIICIVGVTVLLVSAIIVFVLLIIYVGYAKPQIKLPCGIIEGDIDMSKHVYKFESIPYAVPPLGNKRFKRSEPRQGSTCWKGVLDVKSTPQQCIQPQGGSFSGSEDCLYLSVYTPSVDPRKGLPVMVYFHPGFQREGNITDPYRTPTTGLSNDYNIVMVAVQYRLGVFGYMTVQSDKGTGTEGNFGMSDQILALRWIHQNINLFGGSSKKVTLFGGSAVLPLLVSPPAVGLFARAWVCSGAIDLNTTIAEAWQQNQFIFEQTNCTDAACLRSLSAEDLFNASYPSEWLTANYSKPPSLQDHFTALTVVDDLYLPSSIMDSWLLKSKGCSDVPIVIGSTAQETEVSPPRHTEPWSVDSAYKLLDQSLSLFNCSDQATRSLYNYTEGELIYANVVSDIRQTCLGNLYASTADQMLNSTVYRYVVDHQLTSHRIDIPESKSTYASHGLDILAFFKTLDRSLSRGLKSPDQSFQDNFISSVLSFVKTGIMNNEKWVGAGNVTALIGEVVRYRNGYQNEACDHWEKLSYVEHAWKA